MTNSAQKQIFTDKIFVIKVPAMHGINFVGEYFLGHTLTCEIENFRLHGKHLVHHCRTFSITFTFVRLLYTPTANCHTSQSLYDH